jgi:hypothetical protein
VQRRKVGHVQSAGVDSRRASRNNRDLCGKPQNDWIEPRACFRRVALGVVQR